MSAGYIDNESVYTLGSNPAERDRLYRQSDDLHAHAMAMLDHAELRPGAAALDLGCGPRGTIELLSQRVGPTGRVTGIEINPLHVELARELVLQQGLSNVEVLQGDARRTGLPSATFDLVHSRLLLVNIPRPHEVVAEMARLTKPGGWVVLEEADAAVHLCHPPHPAWDRLTEIFHAVYSSDGADLFVGRKLASVLRDQGMVDVGTEARADVYPDGHHRRTIHADLVLAMREKIVERGIADADDLETADTQVRAHLADPHTLVLPHLYFLAWGRKPNQTEARLC